MAGIVARVIPRVTCLSRTVLRLPQARQLSSSFLAIDNKTSRLGDNRRCLSFTSTRLAQFQGNSGFEPCTSSTEVTQKVRISAQRNKIPSPVRQNFHEDCECAINKQIALEWEANYTYQAIAWYFDQDDVALKGFHNFFKDMAWEEYGHVEKWMSYLNKRGGRMALQSIPKPACSDWGSGLHAMETALVMERRLNGSLLELHCFASHHTDAHLTDFIEEQFLQDQVEAIKMLADYATMLRRVGSGVGEYIFDKETLQEEMETKKLLQVRSEMDKNDKAGKSL